MKVTKKNIKADKDPQKEKEIQVVIQSLTENGYKVRREELGRGFGWKATSGACRVLHDKVLFIDRRLPQNEQLNVLLETKRELLGTPSAGSADSTAGAVSENSIELEV